MKLSNLIRMPYPWGLDKSIKEITKEIFEDEGLSFVSQTFRYSSIRAERLYREGIHHKKLAIAKWKFVLSCKKKGISVLGLLTACGYCFRFKCFECSLGKGTDAGLEWCGTHIKYSSTDMTLKEIKYILKCVKKGRILKYRQYGIILKD